DRGGDRLLRAHDIKPGLRQLHQLADDSTSLPLPHPRLRSVQGQAVVVEEVTRVFEPRRKPDAPAAALARVSVEIPHGEIHGLLGPNGAGKTTLVKILSTVLVPTSGRACVLGHDVVEETRAVRPLIGIVFGGERGLYWRLTGRQNLEYWGALYKLSASR